MKQIVDYIIEKFKINSKTVNNLNSEYEKFGKGKFEILDVEDFVKEVFNIKMTDQKIIDFYNNLKYYKIDPDTEFYHIPNKNIDNKLKTKFDILKSKDSNTEYNYLNVGNSKRPELQIAFKNFPNKKIFTIVFVAYINGKIINEYFLYYR